MFGTHADPCPQMIRKGIRPRFSVAFDQEAGAGEFREAMPFRRSWLAIALVAIFDLVFIIPAILTFREAVAAWARFDNLFDLVGALFLSAWLLGWCFAPLALTTLLLLTAFGREVIRARPGALTISTGLPGIGLGAEYAVAAMRNLRIEKPPPKSAKSWRGTHLVFDYGANSVSFGTDLDESDLQRIRGSIETASGKAIRGGEATPEERQGKWRLDVAPPEDVAAGAAEAATPEQPVRLLSPSVLALILANLVPVFGAVYLGWQLSDVMVLYWSESAVIGLFNVLKIAVVGRWLALVAAPFFVSHFGAFMAVHFLFIYGFFVQGLNDFSVGDLREVMRTFTDLWPALFVLFISHAVSFFVNFIGRGERGRARLEELMSEPYSRIIFMHLVIIFGGGLALVLGEATPALLLVILVKIIVDVRAHMRQHGGRAAA